MSIATTEEPPALGAFVPNRSDQRAGQREIKKLRKDPHRRHRFLNHVRSDCSVIRAAVATLDALLEFSNDTAGPVFPGQARLAHDTGQSVRTVQRHLRELREAGYLLVYCYPPERAADTGQWRRRKTNRYYFTFCKSPGRGRRVRRGGHPEQSVPVSHLHDTHDAMNPLGINNHRPGGGVGGFTNDLFVDVRHSAPKAPTPPPPSGSWSDQKGCVSCDYTRFIIDDAGLATRCSCTQS